MTPTHQTEQRSDIETTNLPSLILGQGTGLNVQTLTRTHSHEKGLSN